MKEKDLQYFEHLCDTLYGPSQEQDRRRAENEIAAITKNSSFANEIEWGTGGSYDPRSILNNSHSANSLIYLSISLKHIILDNWTSLSTARRLELRGRYPSLYYCR